MPVTFTDARVKLLDELRLLGARSIILSCNRFPTDDPGIAIYFTIGKRQMAMACDRYDNQAANCRSLGLNISAMRQLKRHGGGVMMDRAFNGFAALPSPNVASRPWREVLGLTDNMRVDTETIDRCYRVLARKVHPDTGGSHEAMSELNVAREQALREIDENG